MKPAKAKKSESKGASASKPKKSKNSKGGSVSLHPQMLVQIHDNMMKSRCLEERLIRMFKTNNGFFWIGSVGEEAFQVPLGSLIKKGEGVDYDFLHLHYRCSPVLVTMGIDPADAMRQMKNTVTDPYSGGRNFSNHYSIRKWNVVPVTSTIETQYATAIGTGIAQAQNGGDSLTVVTGGDAGTAEGEFASSLIWSTKPDQQLPMLIIVMNNAWGISTSAATQHSEHIADRGKAFGMKTMTINGNSVQESYTALQEAMDYIREERRPVLMEARVSRLYGHSSATGANYVENEEDCITTFEKELEKEGVLSRKEMDQVREKYETEFRDTAKKIIQEPQPEGDTIHDYTFWQQKGGWK